MYKELFDAIKIGTVDAVREAASEIFGTAVSVTDINFKVLSADKDPGSTDEMLEFGNDEIYVSEELLTLFREHNLITNLATRPHETLVVDWGYFEEYPHITTGIFWENQIIGTIAVLVDDKNYTQKQDESLQACADALALVLHTNESGKKILSNEKNRFVSKLFGGNVKEKDVDKAIERKYLEKSERYVVLASEYNPESAWKENIFNNTKLLYYNQKGISFFLAAPESVELLNMQVKLESRGYSYGLSNIFHDIMLTDKMANQAEAVLDYARGTPTKKAAWTFSDYIFDILIQNHENEMYAVHPGIIEMEQYDAKYNTEYLNTLGIWLDNRMDYSETAKKLHLHRNSLYYRMQRINEIFSLDITDMHTCVYLYLSLYANKLK